MFGFGVLQRLRYFRLLRQTTTYSFRYWRNGLIRSKHLCKMCHCDWGLIFLRHVIEGSIRVCYARAKARATLLKARLGLNSTMAWVLHELRVH